MTRCRVQRLSETLVCYNSRQCTTQHALHLYHQVDATKPEKGNQSLTALAEADNHSGCPLGGAAVLASPTRLRRRIACPCGCFLSSVGVLGDTLSVAAPRPSRC